MARQCSYISDGIGGLRPVFEGELQKQILSHLFLLAFYFFLLACWLLTIGVLFPIFGVLLLFTFFLWRSTFLNGAWASIKFFCIKDAQLYSLQKMVLRHARKFWLFQYLRLKSAFSVHLSFRCFFIHNWKKSSSWENLLKLIKRKEREREMTGIVNFKFERLLTSEKKMN